ncbi:hypothetical protein ACIPWL_04370 [Streptomyces sp. NPDC090023]|uniref:hypothetical protein n=1 Tax=unclassified Streptomyces TaxID=2593676 RepID=UPI003822012D
MIEGISGAIAVGISTVLGMASDQTSKKRAQAFTKRYGSYEGFRRQVDEDRVQEVRRSKGKVAAIKEVRDNYPYVSLPMAKRYVEQLPGA